MRRLRIFIVHGEPEVYFLWKRVFGRAAGMFEVVGGGSYLSAKEAMAALRKIDPPLGLALTSLRFCPADSGDRVLSQGQAIRVYERAMGEGIAFVKEASEICPVFVVSGTIESWLMRARKAGAAWVGPYPNEEADLPERVYSQYLALAETTA